MGAHNAEYVADHEHVYRCQDCGEIGRAPDDNAYAEGYENGKKAAESGQYAKGWQDCFADMKAKLLDSFHDWGMEPIPAHIDGPVDLCGVVIGQERFVGAGLFKTCQNPKPCPAHIDGADGRG